MTRAPGAAARTVLSALRLAYRSSPRATLGLHAATLLTSLTPVASALALRALLDALSTRRSHQALVAVTVGAIVALLATGLQLLGAYLRAVQSAAIVERTEEELTERLCGFVGLRYFEDPRFRDKVAVAGSAAQSAPSTITDAAMRTLQTAGSALGFLTALLVVWPPMVLLLAIGVVPAVLGHVRLARREVAATEGAAEAGRENSFLRFMITERQAAQEIRIYGLGPMFVRRIVDAVRLGNGLRLGVARQMLRLELAVAALSGGTLLLGTVVAVRGVIAGRLSIGDLTLFTAAATTLYAGLLGLIGAFGQVASAVTLFGHYVDVMAAPQDLPSGTRTAAPLREAVVFDDVWFRYDVNAPWALQGVTLQIPAGESLGLVGANGAGKSTVIKLLCRMYDPDRGRILWDGVDLRDLDPVSVRTRMGVTFQDFVTYDATMRDNIGFGDIARLDDLEAIRESAAAVDLDATFAALPRGYSTRLSRSFMDLDAEGPQRGVDLSGGQRQRLALARSLMRSESDLWILDEPTAALDPEAEQQVHRLLQARRAGRSTLLVSHRLSAVRDAGRIVVLEDGAVAEEGTHAELLSAGGRYAAYFEAQADGYRELVAVGDEAAAPMPPPGLLLDGAHG